MSSSVLSKNYFIIWYTFLKYLPSRFFVILNSLLIIPLFAHILSSNEMSMFQLSIGVLNLVCTCSTDWITKSVLRFWMKYKRKNKLESFFTSLFFIALLSYLFILIIYFFFSDTISSNFFIDKRLLLLTLFLVIPCGIRQFLYQMLRLFNKPFLYTISIVIYQLSLLCLFFVFSYKMDYIFAILEAMAISIFLIDIFIIKQLNLKIKLNLRPSPSIIKEGIKYSLPLIVTNVSIWMIFHANKFIFQYNHYFLDTAMVGIAWFFTTNILAPIFSTFLFSVFPTIIKKFENELFIKSFVTNTLQLYFATFIPFVCIFCFFPQEIAKLFLSEKYFDAYILLPFFAISLFLHELIKLLNIKYHLKNRTYIEMVLSFVVGIISLILSIIFIPRLHLLAAGAIMLFSMFLLIIANSFVNFKSIDYIAPWKILKTVIMTIFIAFLSFLLVNLSFTVFDFNQYLIIIKIIMFIGIYYLITLRFKAKILK